MDLCNSLLSASQIMSTWRGFRKLKTTWPGLSIDLPNSTMSHVFVLCTGLQKRSTANWHRYALNVLISEWFWSSITFRASPSLYTPSRQLRSSSDTRLFRLPSCRIKSNGTTGVFRTKSHIYLNPPPLSVRHASLPRLPSPSSHASLL